MESETGRFGIMSMRGLMADPPLYSSAVQDDCVNIHSSFDLTMAAHEMSPYSKEIAVGDRMIGEGHPAFVIAEAACNHMCDLGACQGDDRPRRRSRGGCYQVPDL